MAIDYRSVDADELKKVAKRTHALEKEMEAYGAEVEVERLTELAKQVTKRQDKEAVRDLLVTAKDEAKARRARATKVKSEVKITSSDELAVQKEFLNRWITSLEQEHLSHEIVISQKEEALAETGDGALSEEETTQAMQDVENSREAIKTIETSWNVATSRLDALNNPPKPPKKTK